MSNFRSHDLESRVKQLEKQVKIMQTSLNRLMKDTNSLRKTPGGSSTINSGVQSGVSEATGECVVS